MRSLGERRTEREGDSQGEKKRNSLQRTTLVYLQTYRSTGN